MARHEHQAHHEFSGARTNGTVFRSLVPWERVIEDMQDVDEEEKL